MKKLGELLDQLKAKISKYGSKKIIEKAAVIAIIGIICLIAGSVLLNDTVKKNAATTAPSEISREKPADPTAAVTMSQTKGEVKSDTEENLRSILSQIKGAGKVDVMITFVSGNESVPARDIKTSDSSTHEKDKEGGTRNIGEGSSENSVVYEERQGEKRPFVVKEILPQVRGVVIVADGAGDAVVRSNLTKAAEALLEVAAHKIQVFQRRSN